MSPLPYRPGLHVIFRPKLSGLGFHYGVLLVGGDGSPRGVRHYGTGGWEAATTLEGFAQGRPVKFESHVPQDPAALHRWVTVSMGGVRADYDLLESNCEHQANWLAQGRKASAQASALSVVLGFGAVLAAAWVADQLSSPEATRA